MEFDACLIIFPKAIVDFFFLLASRILSCSSGLTKLIGSMVSEGDVERGEVPEVSICSPKWQPMITLTVILS